MIEETLHQEFNSTYLRTVGINFESFKIAMEFLAVLQEELQVRVGRGIADVLSSEQLRLYEECSSQEEASAWLRDNRPDYPEIINHCKCELHYEILHYRDSILGVSSLDPIPYSDMDIYVLDMSIRSTRTLKRAGIHTVGEIIASDHFAKGLRMSSLLPRSAREIKRKLWELYFPDDAKPFHIT